MHLYRFYCGNILDKEIILGKEERNKIKNVLRLKPKDRIVLFNNSSKEFLAEIVSFGKEDVKCRILEFLGNIEEPELQITLAQSFLKKDKIELVIGKTTEIGINKIILFKSERSVMKVSLEKKEEKLKRYYKIARSSSEQAKRGIVPEICLSNFKDVIEMAKDYSLSLIFHQDAKNNLKEVLKKIKKIENILVIIGPEGGFTEEEIRKAEENNIYSVSLKKRILKSETTAIIVPSLIFYEYGDI